MRPAEPPCDWIFLRGLVRESAHWGDFPDRFSERIPNSRVWPIDLPGNGVHWRLPSPITITATMEFARREALAVQPSGPRYLFAISLGAMVALEWLHRHPSEIAGAVLVNTSLSRLSPFHRRLSWRAWSTLLGIVLQRDIQARERAILELTSHRGAEPAQVALRVEAYRRHPIQRLNLIRQLRAAASYRSPPERPKAPVLLLNSRGDRLVDPACSEAIARHWHVPLATHPWAGHDLPLDDPEWILAEVSGWLAALGHSPASGNRFVT